MDSPAPLLTARRRALTDRRRDAGTDPGLVGYGLGLASFGIGIAGLVVPGMVGRIMKIERSTVWVLAVRDLASAWLILAWGGSPAFLSRALFDLGDAVLMIRRRPVLAVVAGVSSVVGFATHRAVRSD